MGIIIRQSIKGTIVNYAGTLIGFVTTFFVLTRFLSTEEIGLVRVLIDASILFMSIAQLGTSSSIVRFYPYFKNKNDDNGFFFWTLIVPLVGFLFCASLFWIFRESIIGFFEEKSPLFVTYYHAVFPIAFFMLYQQIFEVNANVLMRIVVPRFVREVLVRIFTLVAYLLYAFDVFSLSALVWSLCIVYVLATLCNVYYLFSLKKISLKPNLQYLTKPLIKNYLFYTLFLIATALSSAITPSLNTFFISAKMGLQFTGIFTIAMYIAAMIEIPYRSLGAIVQPQLAQTIKDNNLIAADQLVKKVSLHQFLVGTFIFFAIWINIDLIFLLLPNGDQYVAGRWVVLLLSFAKLINSSFFITTVALNYSRYYVFSLLFTFLLTFVAILLNIWLIPYYGMNGAALASLGAYLVYYVVALSLILPKVKVNPFSLSQLKVMSVVIVLFLLDTCWKYFFESLFTQSIVLMLVESIVRLGFLLLLGTWVVYKWKISIELNNLINSFLNKK